MNYCIELLDYVFAELVFFTSVNIYSYSKIIITIMYLNNMAMHARMSVNNSGNS